MGTRDGGLFDRGELGRRARVAVGAVLPLFAMTATGCSHDKWSEVPEPTQGDLRAMWGTSASDIWATGRDGAAAHWDGTAWTSVKLPTTSDVVGIWGTGADNVWAVGGGNASGHGAASCVLLHLDGASFGTRACPPGAETSPLYAVHGTAPNDVWAVGGGPVAIHWDGNRWATTSVPPREGRLVGVYAAGPKDVWAVGRSSIFHFDGGTWSLAQAVPEGLSGIWGRAANDVWAFGATQGQAALLHYDGTAWKSVACPPTGGPDPIEGAWGTRADETFFVQADGDVYRSNGKSCSPLKKPEARRVHAIWGAGDMFFLAGEDGRTFQHLPR